MPRSFSASPAARTAPAARRYPGRRWLSPKTAPARPPRRTTPRCCGWSSGARRPFPPAPGPPSVAAVSETALSVAWTLPDGAPDIIDYDIQYRAAATQAFVHWPHAGLATDATLSGLATGTRYAVRVRASNGFGAGDWSRTAFGRTAGDPTDGGTGGADPGSNQGPVFENPSAFSVPENTTVAGALNAGDADDADVVTGYSIVGGADRELFRIDPAPATLRFADAPDFERPLDAAAENRYAVTVEASSGAGARTRTTTQAITVTVTDVDTEAPGRPALPQVTFDSATTATATWTAPANAGPPIVDYDVRFRRSPGDGYTDAAHDGSATRATLSSTASGWSFEVQVRASNDAGTGDWSEPGHGSRIELPDGFTIRAWAEGVTDARSMALGFGGTVFVGTRSDGGGRVYALRDEDGDLWAERSVTLARGLNRPNGVAFRAGDLYVAENSRVLRYADIETRLDAPPAPQVVTDAFPTDRSHGWKFIRFGPDGDLYVPVGAPCNICLRDDPYATIGRLNVATGVFTVIARGVRNTVGFDWHPQSGDTVVHGQRPGLDGRRPPTRRTEPPRRERLALRLSLLPRRRQPPTRTSTTAPAAISSPPSSISAPTLQRSACASTRETCFRRNIGIRSSSPNTAPGTAAARSATASCSCGCGGTGPPATNLSPPAGYRRNPTGAARSTCW